MNRYRQLTSEERHTLSTLRKQGYRQAAIARALGRHRSTISREVRRNSKDRGGPSIGRASPKTWLAIGDATDRVVMRASAPAPRLRRASSNSGARSRCAGWLRRNGALDQPRDHLPLRIWREKARWQPPPHLRCSPKQRRKRYGTYDSRGRLAGKDPERPVHRTEASRPPRSRYRHRQYLRPLACSLVVRNRDDR